MKTYFLRNILIFTFCISLQSSSSIRELGELDPTVHAKCNALIKTRDEMAVFFGPSFSGMNVSQCKAVRAVIDAAFESITTLWSSTTFWGEKDAGLQALNNRLGRFPLMGDQRDQVEKLHAQIVRSFLLSLVSLKEENEKGWQWILKRESYYNKLNIFRTHLEVLEGYKNGFMLQSLWGTVTKFKESLQQEKKRRAALLAAERERQKQERVFRDPFC